VLLSLPLFLLVCVFDRTGGAVRSHAVGTLVVCFVMGAVSIGLRVPRPGARSARDNRQLQVLHGIAALTGACLLLFWVVTSLLPQPVTTGAFDYSSPVDYQQAVHTGLWASLALLGIALCKLSASRVGLWFGVTEETYTDEGQGQGSGTPGKSGAGEAKPARNEQDRRRFGR
jgi:hypothetical protein